MFNFPLEQFFDTCSQLLMIHDLPESGGRQFVTQWLADCAMHPAADTGEGERLSTSLSQYTWAYPREGRIDDGAWGNMELYAAQPGFRGEFPEMVQGLQAVVSSLGAELVEPALQQFVQVAMNLILVFSKYAGSRASHGYRQSIWQVGLYTTVWAWNNMLDDPFSGVPSPLRQCLLTVNPMKLSQEIMGHIRVKAGMFGGTPTPGSQIHFVVWADLLHAASLIPDPSNSHVYMTAVNINRQRNPAALDYLLNNTGIPEFFRPTGISNQVIAELNARLGPPDGQAQAPVPLEVMGPPIEASDLGQCLSSVPADECCTICCEDFTDPAEKIIRLNACSHLFHEECIEALANRVYTRPPVVLCPNCRTRLCDARDYRAVLE
jgi:hypothetical protein